MRALVTGILLVVGLGLGMRPGASDDGEAGKDGPTTSAEETAETALQEDAVMETIDALFAAMAAKDTAALAAVFHAEARLNSTSVRDGRPVLTGSPVEDFVRGIGSASADLDERLGPAEVRVDGPLATAWTPYAFFADGEFSHCGVNAFQLVRTDDGWKILQVTDTRRRAGCPAAAPR